MDKIDNETMREELPDAVSPAREPLVVTGIQGSADVDKPPHTRLARPWEGIRSWLRASAFSPEWLTAPWNHPVVGYLFAILVSVGAIMVTFLLIQLVPTFAFSGALAILVILGVALLWGTGPGLLATLLETILLNFFILMPHFPGSLTTFQNVFETCLFLILGIAISLVTSTVEHARAEAEAYRQRLHDLFMQAPTPILVLSGPEHRFELINQHSIHDFGQQDIVGKTVHEVMPEYIPPEFLQLLDQVYTTGKAHAVKEQRALANQHEDGALKEQYFDVIYQPTRTTRGEVDGIMVLGVDVTEQVLSRKRIEELVAQLKAEKEALRNAQQRAAERASEVEAILEVIVDGVIIFDGQGHVLHMNRAALNLLGRDSKPDYSLRAANERPSLYNVRDEQGQLLFAEQWPLLRVLAGEVLTGTTATDVIINARDGRQVQLNVSGAPVSDQDGQIGGAVIVMRDVTERRRIEQRTQEALDALLAMARLIGQLPGEVDVIGDKTHQQTEHVARNVAQHMAEITRKFLDCQRLSISIIEPETGIQRPLAVVGLSPEQERQWWAEQQQESRLSDNPDQSLVQRLQANEIVLFEMSQPPWNAFPNPYGIRTMLMAPLSIRDRLIGLLTLDYRGADHKYTSEELAMTAGVAKIITVVVEHERLMQERTEIYARELALRETNQRMDEFLGIVSHELMTPLTTIKGNVQLGRLRLRSSLREVPADNEVLRSMLEEIQMMLERAERQVNVQNRLVSDLLDISRLQADKLELRMMPCDLVIIVREMVEDQRSTTPTRTIDLDMAEGETALVIADTERIGQVLSNYLTNALKYSPADRPVNVQLKKDGNKVRLAVRDEGPGLTTSEQERIWERFYQAQGIKRQRGSSVGLGLGLYICRTIIEQHQGEIGVESTKGMGSTFWFTLPLAESDDEEAV